MTNPYFETDDDNPYLSTPKKPKPSKAGSFGMGAVQGVLQSGADEVAAAAGTLFQKASGDPRPWGAIYRHLQADADKGMRETMGANPGYGMAGNAAGAIAGTVATGAGKALPAALTATIGRKLMTGGVTGAASGALSGGLNAAPGQRADGAIEGGLWGGAFGFGAGLLGEAAKQGARVVGLGPRAVPVSPSASTGAGAAASSPVGSTAPAQGPRLLAGPQNAQGRVGNTIGRVQSFFGLETAEEAGARRVLGAAAKEGKSLDDLRQWSIFADSDDTIAEGIGKQGMILTRTTRALGRKAPGMIDDALEDRAANETSRLSAKLKELSGATARDAEVVAKEELDKVRPTTGPLYQRTQGRAVGDSQAAAVLAELKDLDDKGLGIWKSASVADKNFPAEFTDALSVGQVQRLRQVLDRKINYGATREGMSSIEAAAQDRLKALRAQLDELAKDFGGDDFVEADELTAAAAQRGRSFAFGEDALRAMSDDQLDQLAQQGGDLEFFRKGVGSGLQKKLAGVADEGTIQNPVPRVLGGQAKRDVARRAFTDQDSFDLFRQAGKNAASRLKFFRDVTGGSQTLDKAVGALDFVTDDGPLKDAANPRGLIEKALESQVAKRLLRQSGIEADAAADLLLAGAPGAKSRDEVLKALEQMAPIIRKRLSAQAVRRGVVGSSLTPRSSER